MLTIIVSPIPDLYTIYAELKDSRICDNKDLNRPCYLICQLTDNISTGNLMLFVEI